MKILILGGYGVFGGRLAQLLLDEPELTLLIAGRNLQKAQTFCNSKEGRSTLKPVRLDRANLDLALSEHRPDIVVDASGPFQEYGADCYSVIEACLKHKVNYLDFADGADFVFGISRFDEQAKEAGVFILSGVSSFPVLSAAVLREMAKHMTIETVTGGIAPSPYAGIGLNVMRAVVGYAGSEVKLTRGGRQSAGIGLAESKRFTIAVPGALPLRNIHFSLVDVPDLQILPREHGSIRDIWMGAGPVPEFLHRALNLLAKLRAALSLPSFVPFSRLFYWVLNLMKFGEHRGGMFMAVKGIKDGRPAATSWHLLAEGDDGPLIPSMAIEGVVRQAMKGRRPDVGARPATCALELHDYDALFANRTISTGFRDDRVEAPIYRKVLGDAFETLPEQVQLLHNSQKARRWSGVATVTRGPGLFAGLFSALFGFPKSAQDIPVTVDFAPKDGGELWTRTFGKTVFSSLQKEGMGRDKHLITEKFGAVTVSLAAVITGEKLMLIPRRWSMFGIPLPRFLLPGGNSHETQQDGKFVFDVEMALPFFGLIVAYKGTLAQV